MASNIKFQKTEYCTRFINKARWLKFFSSIYNLRCEGKIFISPTKRVYSKPARLNRREARFKLENEGEKEGGVCLGECQANVKYCGNVVLRKREGPPPRLHVGLAPGLTPRTLVALRQSLSCASPSHVNSFARLPGLCVWEISRVRSLHKWIRIACGSVVPLPALPLRVSLY